MSEIPSVFYAFAWMFSISAVIVLAPIVLFLLFSTVWTLIILYQILLCIFEELAFNFVQKPLLTASTTMALPVNTIAKAPDHAYIGQQKKVDEEYFDRFIEQKTAQRQEWEKMLKERYN
jgi:hypothetical protein